MVFSAVANRRTRVGRMGVANCIRPGENLNAVENRGTRVRRILFAFFSYFNRLKHNRNSNYFMPTLHWIGKEKVINHHLDVPYKVLEHTYHFDNGIQTLPSRPEDFTGKITDTDSNDIVPGESSSSNKIIHGDNLEALKSLLPEYEGKIKCIYIDPPYNTGNEGWVYNDNVTDPKIKKWLGQVVGKESEDLSRHDKWLCMMYPRLKLLHKLLADDGAIFISIDDNEQANLKLILDEIFGGRNFVANILWQKRTSPDARLNLGPAHDFVICYTNTYNPSRKQFNLLPPSDSRVKDFKNLDFDHRGSWASVDLTGQIGHATESQFYEIITPSGEKYFPPKDRCWALNELSFLDLKKDNRIWFGKNGNSKPRLKKFLLEIDGVSVWTWWSNLEVGHNQEATKEIKTILPSDIYFETPKPIRLLERIIQLSTDKNSIILDSFAGSGTTAHAVLNLNKQDGGNRKFILIELESYAETITAERVKRVISGYGDKEGTGGSFDFYTLGEPMFDDEGLLNEKVGVEKIRQYVYYTETKQSLNRDFADLVDFTGETKDHHSFMGKHNDTAYYFHYDPEQVTTLNHDFLAALKTRAEQYVIYADNCVLTRDFMTRHHLIFKKIPRDITRF